MRKAKYIIVSDSVNESPVLFPEWMQHSEVARALVGADGVASGQIIGAGFVTIYSDPNLGSVVECSGESLSLGIKPGQYDARMIQRALGIE